MDTQFLETLKVVIDSGSFAEAARQLNLTPAAVAQRVRAVEVEIGTPLVSRFGRTVQPTAAGVAVTSHINSLLSQVRDLKALAVGELMIGELRLGAIATAVTGLLPGLLKGLAEHHPQVEVYVVPGTSDNLYRRVSDGDLDIAIIVEPAFVIPKPLAWRTLREEPLVVIAPSHIAIDDPHAVLANEPLVRYDHNHWGGRLADNYLRQARIQPRERFELDALDAIAVLVDRGLGVSLVPDWAPPWPAGLSLNKKAVPLPGHDRRIGAIWRRASPRTGLINALLERL